MFKSIYKFINSVPKPVWAISANHGCVDLTAGAFYIVLPFLKAKFGLSYLEVTVVVLVNSLASSIVQPLFGYFSDRKPRAWFMPLGCLITGVTLPLILFSPRTEFIYLLTMVNGLGSAAFHPLGAKTANLVTGYNMKGRSLSIFSMGGSLGVMLGSVYISLLMKMGIGWHMWLYSLPSVMVAASMFRLIPSLPPYPPAHKREDGKTALSDVFKLSMVAFFGMMLARAIIASGLNTFVPLYYISHLEGDQLVVSILLSVFQAACVVGTLVGGVTSDQYGSKRVMLVTMLPIALLLYFFQISGPVGLFVTLALTGVLLSATNTSSLALIQKLLPNNLAMASGINLGLSSGLSALGIIVLGNVADLKGVETVFIILSLLPIWGFIMTLFIKEPKRS